MAAGGGGAAGGQRGHPFGQPVAASDAYFPFADGFEILAEARVAAVVEPGGSIRDHLTITAAEAAGIPLYFTGVRHFYH